MILWGSFNILLLNLSVDDLSNSFDDVEQWLNIINLKNDNLILNSVHEKGQQMIHLFKV